MRWLELLLVEVKVNGGYFLVKVFSHFVRLLPCAFTCQIASTRVGIGSSFFLHVFFKFNTNYNET